MKKWLKEPLFHFLLAGALIFAIDTWINGGDGLYKDKIVVSLSQQDNLAGTFARTWQRPPTDAEMNALIGDFIRQEIAYREGAKMQLDRDDIVMRRRMRQKFEMLAEDVALLTQPTEAEAKAYFQANTENFRQPAVVTMRQIFFKNDAAARRAASSLLETLQHDESSVDFATVGDTSLLPGELAQVREPDLKSLFGSDFAEAVQKFEPGRWSGPINSTLGLHLVKIDARIESRTPQFEAVADYVTRELLVLRRNEAIDALYARLAENFDISIEARANLLPKGVMKTSQ